MLKFRSAEKIVQLVLQGVHLISTQLLTDMSYNDQRRPKQKCDDPDPVAPSMRANHVLGEAKYESKKSCECKRHVADPNKRPNL